MHGGLRQASLQLVTSINIYILKYCGTTAVHQVSRAKSGGRQTSPMGSPILYNCTFNCTFLFGDKTLGIIVKQKKTKTKSRNKNGGQKGLT